MNEYTASNGIGVRHDGRDLDIKNTLGWVGICGGVVVDALREFFRAEEDERLGRWRWPALPEYVAYWHPVLQRLTVTWEPEGGSTFFKRDDDLTYAGNPGKVARAYFDAHPEPNQIPNEPRTAWVDKYGTDVWHVGTDGVIRCVLSPGSDPRKYAPFTRLVPEVTQ